MKRLPVEKLNTTLTSSALSPTVGCVVPGGNPCAGFNCAISGIFRGGVSGSGERERERGAGSVTCARAISFAGSSPRAWIQPHLIDFCSLGDLRRETAFYYHLFL